MTRTAQLAGLLVVLGPARGGAQHPTVDWGAQAIPAFTQTNVVPGGRSLGELRVVQPVLMLHAGALGGRLRLVATANFEKWTIPNGELAPGVWGEGFEDRRHPHTVAHELMLVAPSLAARGETSLFLAAGKGFVPFGTDDPMSRPPIRFPVNHHLSQILERAVAIAGVRAGPVMVEAALFNGDEPVSPQSWPSLSRFGDSWASRVTLRPRDGLELQGSYAFVNSPENRPGAGPGDVHWSASGRWERGPAYGLVEWARTAVNDGVFIYHSVLAEGAVSHGRHRAYVRAERTERPEEERLFDNGFRIVRPVLDNSILGVTRWTILTIGDGFTAKPMGPVQLTPFAEGSVIWVAKVGGGVFDPSTFYGGERGFSLTVGLRIGGGMRMPRMGQYSSPGAAHEHVMEH